METALRNPMPVEALYDWDLLQRHGFERLEAVQARSRAEGELETLRAAVLDVFAARGLDAGPDVRAAVAACSEPAVLREWLKKAATLASAAELLADP